MLGPVLDTPDLRLTCHEGEFEELLGELAQHHLDLVLAGQGAPANPNLRLTSDRLVSSPVDWYGPRACCGAPTYRPFPQSLERLPVLLPTGHSVLRQTLDRWFREQGIHPNVVGEFEDSALMSVFAARPGRVSAQPAGRRRYRPAARPAPLARCDAVHEEIHAIRNRRGQNHPWCDASWSRPRLRFS